MERSACSDGRITRRLNRQAVPTQISSRSFCLCFTAVTGCPPPLRPLASQRCCQVWPGKPARCSSRNRAPRERRRTASTPPGQTLRTTCWTSSIPAEVRSPCGLAAAACRAGSPRRPAKRVGGAGLTWCRRAVPGSPPNTASMSAGSYAGRVGPLRPGPGVVLLELVVHVLDPGHQVVARGVQVGMTQDRLHLGEREALVAGHPGSGGMTGVVQAPVRAQPLVGPLQHPPHRPVRHRPLPAPAGPPHRLPSRRQPVRSKVKPQVAERVRRCRDRLTEPGPLGHHVDQLAAPVDVLHGHAEKLTRPRPRADVELQQRPVAVTAHRRGQLVPQVIRDARGACLGTRCRSLARRTSGTGSSGLRCASTCRRCADTGTGFTTGPAPKRPWKE